ncbi:chemotaxis-specific protein-glutamate methyltransferase CheB [Vampirovibrio sp.]|uniref:chemotaxis-specific protein-glutamate methyltransferase CheB n=1 Tax=Vampirovibrio sp. TaxID=2717857 RepID=UPI0035940F8D
MSQTLKVMIVDDTVTYRSILRTVLEDIPETQVVETAINGKQALVKLNTTAVDLILLDIEMPEMNGLETLAVLRKDYPDIGVIMVSGTNKGSADSTIIALQLGALDFIPKPDEGTISHSKEELLKKLQPVIRHFLYRRDLIEKPRHSTSVVKTSSLTPSSPSRSIINPNLQTTVKRFDVLVIGISTGGPNALTELVPKLPEDLGIPILIVQHMPPVFTESLAKSLDKKSKMQVKEAVQSEAVVSGTAYIAPGGKHMTVVREKTEVKIVLTEDPSENSCRPSVDVLFRSVAAAYGDSVLSLVMTGMGSDGALGVKFMKQTGCHSLIQSEETCVVYGMPKAVAELNLADEVIPLDQLATRIVTLVKVGKP